jgi:hypothetical protein
MKWRARAVAATPCHGPLQLLVMRWHSLHSAHDRDLALVLYPPAVYRLVDQVPVTAPLPRKPAINALQQMTKIVREVRNSSIADIVHDIRLGGTYDRSVS